MFTTDNRFPIRLFFRIVSTRGRKTIPNWEKRVQIPHGTATVIRLPLNRESDRPSENVLDLCSDVLQTQSEASSFRLYVASENPSALLRAVFARWSFFYTFEPSCILLSAGRRFFYSAVSEVAFSSRDCSASRSRASSAARACSFLSGIRKMKSRQLRHNANG